MKMKYGYNSLKTCLTSCYSRSLVRSTMSDSDKTEATAKKPTGLTKPLSLSNDLAAVLGTMKGEKMSRAQVRPIAGVIFFL